jgi:predicted nucleic acid-binding Zn ribbon protein
MPTYEYPCPANGRVVEVAHRMADEMASGFEA